MNQEKSRIFLQIAVIFFFLLVFFLFVSRNRANRPVLPGNEPERKEIALRKTPVVLAIEKAMPSVVNLSTSKIVDRHYSPWQQKISSRFAMPSERRQDQGYSIGSGSIIDQAGLIVTSAHVVSRAAQIEVTLNNGITFKGRTLAEDIENDVALLQILAPKRDFKTIQGIHPGDMMLGETTIAVGNPYGLDGTITVGVLSGIGRSLINDDKVIFSDLLQTDAAVFPGNSGGPLINLNGKMLYSGFSSSPVGGLSLSPDGCLIYTGLMHPERVTEAELVPSETAETVTITEPTMAETQATETQAETQVTEEAQIPEEVPQEETAATVSQEADVPSAASAMPEETGAVSEEEPTAAAETMGETQAVTETSPEPVTVPVTEPAVETAPETTAAASSQLDLKQLINGKPLSEYEIIRISYWDEEAQQEMVAQCIYLPMEEMTLELYVTPDGLYDDGMYQMLGLIRSFRSDLFLILGTSLLVFAILAVYLCCAAGRKPRTAEVQAGGLNRLPLDLYLLLTGLSIGGIAVLGVELANNLLYWQLNLQVFCAGAAGMGYLACLIFVGFCFAFVAQIKTPGGYWWRNSLCGRVLRLAAKLLRCVKNRLIPGLVGLLRKIWYGLTGFLGRAIHHWMMMLPLVWQWLAAEAAIFLLICIGIATRSFLFTLLCLVGVVVLIIYGANCYGRLWESARRMSQGDLSAKVDDTNMVGAFKDFAQDLNNLSGVAMEAAQQQLKSERMKTELITNVSHDIKTPLTSIINYVDLLQKPHTPEEGEAYLEVLQRQSQRLKKLIEDLMDMSKASTGNMVVEITTVDAVESVNQALGEFADKLEKAQLTPLFRCGAPSMMMKADGKLVWRVLSNLLTNAVKYALPGTRLYVDLMQTEEKVIISLKNISREELNIDADELMERFVRGDGSRNTEGSGLGLNIAKSLMELQHGQLQLLVDGDLFKVTLIFPGV